MPPKKEAAEAPPSKKPRLDAATAAPGASSASSTAAPGASSVASSAASGAANSQEPSVALAAEAASNSANLKAASGAARPLPVKDAVCEMLRLEDPATYDNYLAQWTKEVVTYVGAELPKFLSERKDKLPFKIPSDLKLVAPLEIIGNGAGDEKSHVSAFREVMRYTNLVASFDRTAQYEAAGTIWMLDPLSASGDEVTVGQLESAMALFSEQAFVMSASTQDLRRFSFDVPIPAAVENKSIAQRLAAGKEQVCMAHALPIIAGRAHVVAWYSAMAQSLMGGKPSAARTMKLFEAALSVPIRLRLNPDTDSCHLAALQFTEVATMTAAASGADIFWNFAGKVNSLQGFSSALAQGLSITKLNLALKKYGVTWKGRPSTDAIVKALKALAPFVADPKCKMAYSLVDMCCPELRDATMIMRAAQLCAARSPGASETDQCPASGGADSLVFIFDCMRVARCCSVLKCSQASLY